MAQNTQFKKGMKPWNKGKPFSDETKQKMKASAKLRKPTFTGKKHKETSKNKMRIAKLKNPVKFWKDKNRPDISGSNCHFWKGGISKELYSIDWTKTLRRSIRERDKFMCFICKCNQEDEALSVHHIDYNKKNCNPSNLISLCRSCHQKTNSKREFWVEYFNNLIEK